MGNIKGHVSFPDGTSVGPGMQVWAYNDGGCPDLNAITTTDASGSYDFSVTRIPANCPYRSFYTQNNRGVDLCTGDSLSLMTELYTVVAGEGTPANPPPENSPNAVHGVVVHSSQPTVVDLHVPGTPGPNPSKQSCPVVGLPVSVSTGNAFLSEKDVVIPGVGTSLSFVRTYNSLDAVDGSVPGVFGMGWTHSYEKSISFPSSGRIMLREASGVPLYFQNVSGTYQPVTPVTEQSSFVPSGSSYVRNFRAGGSETYDSLGRLNSIVDPSGNTTVLTRDGSGRLTTVTDPGSRALTLTYSGAQVSSLVGPEGVTIATYTYYPSPSYLLESVTYGDGSGYTFAYTSGNQLSTVTDKSGVVLETHTYDATGRAATTSISGGQEQYTLSYTSGQTTVTDALNNTTTYQSATIAGMTYPTTISGPCSSCGGGGQSQSWTYDDKGRVLTQTDGAGNTTTYTYDQNTGDRLTATNPLNQTTTYTYDSQGRVLTRRDPLKAVRTYTYGPAGPLTIQDPLNRTTTISYTPQGKSATITDPRGKITTLAYNGFGDLISVTDPLGHATTFGYDAMGRRTTATDALSHTTTTTYDDQGRVTRITNPDGTHSDSAYDLGGRRTTTTDPLGRVTQYGYDTYGRLQTVTDPLNGVTTYGYDAMSNMTSLTDARGKVTNFTYDAYNRVGQVTYPGSLGSFETLTYDGVGRLASKTDRTGVVTSYSYDALGRLTGKIYSDGTPPVSFTYDSAGRLLTAANGTDNLGWVYDLAGELTSESSSLNTSVVSSTYDAAGNRLSVGLDGASFLSYAYDSDSRLGSITRGGQVFGFAYDANSRRTQLSDPNGVVTGYAYDTVSRLKGLNASLGSQLVTRADYTYDLAGNRTAKFTSDATEAYAYDPLDRLTEVKQGRRRHHPRLPRHMTLAESYSYDAVGNRLTSLLDPTWSYDARNELTSNTSASFTYDPNGNLIQKSDATGIWTYEWDAEDRLKRVLKNSVEQARFAYDPLGRRVEKVAGGVTTTYTYDGQNILREISGATTLKYVHGPGIDEPLAQEDGAGALTYFHADGLGSIVKTTNSAGAVLTTRRYDAFGNLELGATNGYAFTGREWDPETGLYYYRARYYDPKIGRFLSEDPLPIAAPGLRGSSFGRRSIPVAALSARAANAVASLSLVQQAVQQALGLDEDVNRYTYGNCLPHQLSA